MAVNPTYPGVYVQEVPSGVRTIVGVSTSITLFVGRTKFGPMNTPVRLNNYSDFSRVFGDDNAAADTARYVKLFFQNGGSDCYVTRIAHGAVQSSVTLLNEAGAAALVLTAKNPGTLGDTIRAAVTYRGQYPEATFNLEVFRWVIDSRGQKTKVDREEWNNLTMDPALPTYAPTFLSQKSALVNAAEPGAAAAIGPGFSLSGRAVPTDPADVPTFKTAWAALFGSTQTANTFQISVDGNPFVPVDLKPIVISALSGGSLPAIKTALAGAIQARITAALTANGISAAPVTVELAAGPTPVAAGETTKLRFISGAPGPAFKDIRIISAASPAQDVAANLMLGEANGGTEVGAYAARRPAPTGVTLLASDPAVLAMFEGLLQNQVKSIQLDHFDATGTLVPFTVNVDLQNLPSPGPQRMWNDASYVPPGAPPLKTGYRGLREKLSKIRDAINTQQANTPTSFFWKAEVWGSRLAILNQLGDDNALAPLATAPTNLFPAAPPRQLAANVRFYSLGPGGLAGSQTPGSAGNDGTRPLQSDYLAAYTVCDKQIDLFNLLVLPPDHDAMATPLEQLWSDASSFCASRRAFLIMDPPDAWTTSQQATSNVDALRIGLVKDFSALYFPRLQVVENGRQVTVGPAGAMAGLYARIDSNRGVWKAPAGIEADIRGVMGLDQRFSDAENGQMNPVGINNLRVFPDGVVSWGARTMAGADAFGSEYKYVPIRRVALFMEESLYRGLKWVVFEPNDTALWSQIRLNVGAFMHDLFRKGAFQGDKPQDAYFVKCDAETTTQNDRDLGIVNIWVGFAPLKPAEFVILYLQQIAGQVQT